jgi:hypothetical protein
MTFVKQFNTKADVLMEKLQKSADGSASVALFPELNHATLDAIALVLEYNLLKLNKIFFYYS